MIPRLLLILTFVIQPVVAIGGLGPCAVEQVSSRSTRVCCCGPESCCATQIVPACGCEADSAPQPTEDQPAIPRAIDSQIVLLALVLSPLRVMAAPAEARSTPANDAAPHQTHTEKQAVLCVWRT